MRVVLSFVGLILSGSIGHAAQPWAEIQQCAYECTQGGHEDAEAPRGSSKQCKSECERRAEENDG